MDIRYIIVVCCLLLLILLVILLTRRTSSNGNVTVDNEQSQDRITMLNEAMASALGSKWPFVLLFICIMLFALLGMLYMASRNETASINLSDAAARNLSGVMLVFTITLLIVAVVLAIKQYMSDKNKVVVPNYVPNVDSSNRTKQIASIIALSLFLIVILYFIITYFRRKRETIGITALSQPQQQSMLLTQSVAPVKFPTTPVLSIPK